VRSFEQKRVRNITTNQLSKVCGFVRLFYGIFTFEIQTKHNQANISVE